VDDVDESDAVATETKKTLNISVLRKPQQQQVKTTAEFIASLVPEDKHQQISEQSFLSKKVSRKDKTPRVWGKSGFKGKTESGVVRKESKVESSCNELSTALFGSFTEQQHNLTVTSSSSSDAPHSSPLTFEPNLNFDPTSRETSQEVPVAFYDSSFDSSPMTSDPHISPSDPVSEPSLNEALEKLSVVTKSSEEDKDLEMVLVKTRSDVNNALRSPTTSDDDF